MRLPPKSSARDISRRDGPRKKTMRADDGDDPIMMIRGMFGYKPELYLNDDFDDDAMVADFDAIMREEKRSERIGRREDEEELRKIEEEERTARMRREAKKRKLSNR